MVIWSLVLSAIGLVGLWLSGSLRRAGWAIGVCAQVLWITFAITFEAWGFILSALAYGFVYARNWWRWRAAEREVTE
jgi:hypothetical protein